ncbi:hypothetical protein EWM64_g10518 [Hericium alpestre]|uniref:Uncharacterized protein n=1 Tax=Hericium alpestre TaxID=135208 RepID=A0A4Y9ZI43_9AGAM|nr:hypothetical protein EWM64_g10518 [Hericium alpestre]
MDPNWKACLKEDWYLDALFHMVDGNFKSNQKDKPLDSKDTPLTMNAAYFANEKDFAKFQCIVGDKEKEVSTYHEFGAMGYGTYQGKVSGVKGEHFKYNINCQYQINLRIQLQWFKQHFGHAESIQIFYFP